jgi:hypothetical protein
MSKAIPDVDRRYRLTSVTSLPWIITIEGGMGSFAMKTLEGAMAKAKKLSKKFPNRMLKVSMGRHLGWGDSRVILYYKNGKPA